MKSSYAAGECHRDIASYIRLPFEKINDDQLKAGRTKRLVRGKKKKSVRLVVEEVDDEVEKTSKTVFSKVKKTSKKVYSKPREWLDLTNLDKEPSNREKLVNEIPMEKNLLPATNILNESVPPRKPLIAEVPSVRKQRTSEGLSPLKGSLPREVRINDTNT